MREMLSHTPGPWTVGPHKSDEGRFVYADEPHAVAEAIARGRTAETAHANALIAKLAEVP